MKAISELTDDFPERVEETIFQTAIKNFGAAVVSCSVVNFDDEEAAKIIDKARR